jgi:TetR/AcrR family transcriptional regulator, regulator of cefoperazone and chloramphenicol sensitivity
MATRTTDITQEKTRQRLVEAAGEVFAEQGFRQATVRDICARAGANVAAVNYHFGDKERLYSEVLRFAHGCAIEKYPPSMGLAADAPAEKRLHAFVLSFLYRLLDDGRPAWHAKIMSREMAEPTAAMDVLVEEQVKPHFAYVRQVVLELLGPKAAEETARLCAQSIVGQCLFYHLGRPVTQRLFPHRVFGMKDAPRIANHITRLTLAGIREIAKSMPELPGDAGPLSRKQKNGEVHRIGSKGPKGGAR